MRKTFLKVFGLGCIVAVMCLIYGFFIEPKTLKVRNVDVIEPSWAGEPLTIALISDIHVGGWHVSADRVGKIVETINGQSPDIILIAGDFVDGHEKASDRTPAENTEIRNGITALSGLKTPLGVFAAIGNHDDWYSGVDIRKYLSETSAQILENDARRIQHGNDEFCLVGLPDFWTGKRDIRAFDKCGSGQNVIAFMHSPDSFKYLATNTTLALAGHTHGGQINLPFYGRRVTSTAIGPKYAYGHVDYNGIPGFVTAGIGTSILPARFRAPPEIVLIHLSGE